MEFNDPLMESARTELWVIAQSFVSDLALGFGMVIAVALIFYMLTRLCYSLRANQLPEHYPYWVDRDYSGHSFAVQATWALLLAILVVFLLGLWLLMLRHELDFTSVVLVPLCIIYAADSALALAHDALKEWPT